MYMKEHNATVNIKQLSPKTRESPRNCHEKLKLNYDFAVRLRMVNLGEGPVLVLTCTLIM